MPDLTSPSPLAMVVRPGALAESRDRWRELALLGSALVFETDERQRLVLVEPASAFGWNTADLLGRPLAVLLDPVDGGSPGGIGDGGGRTEALPRDRPLRGRLGWVRRPDGGRAAVRLCTAPVRNGGLRGTVQDVDGAERERRGLAEALSRRQTVREIARRMRRPVLPDTMIRIALGEIVDALGAEGGMIVSGRGSPLPGSAEGGHEAGTRDPKRGRGRDDGGDAAAPVPLPRILHRTGLALPVPDAEAVSLPGRFGSGDSGCSAVLGRLILFARIESHFSDPSTLMLWRDGRSPWLDGDEALLGELAAVLGGVLDHERVQGEFTRQSGSDILTGLLTRDSFRVEAVRRMERGTAEGAPTTLLVIGLDGFAAVNNRHGFETGDAVLRAMARRLRDTFRPTDLLARLHGDVFAVWLDGADHFAAAERAEQLCQHGLAVPVLGEDGPIQLSIGLGSCVGPGGVDGTLEQASAALHAVKLAGGGRWHVYNEGAA